MLVHSFHSSNAANLVMRAHKTEINCGIPFVSLCENLHLLQDCCGHVFLILFFKLFIAVFCLFAFGFLRHELTILSR